MSDLFGDRGSPSTPDKDALRFDWINLFCRERYGAPEKWRWFGWERKELNTPHEFLLVTGAICEAKFERGKHKGADNWKLRDKSTERVFAIYRSDLEGFQLEWQRRTGLCFECYGTGENWAGWSAAEGNRYKPCRHCNATGKIAVAA